MRKRERKRIAIPTIASQNLAGVIRQVKWSKINHTMNAEVLKNHLAGLPVPEIRFFESIGSTNDEALRWASEGAADGSLVAADQQTRGRGRFNRRWVTRAGAALAFSLILHPSAQEQKHLGLFSPLGALAICRALEQTLGLQPQIKWPNDVLLNQRKAAGILVEAAWLGERLQGIVTGIGVNVSAEAVPPDDQVLFPAISVEQAAGQKVDRVRLLQAILQALFYWRPQIGSSAFHQAWEDRLAFKGEWVRVEAGGESAPDRSPITGQVVGIDPAGNLQLRTAENEIRSVAVGDVHLRRVE